MDPRELGRRTLYGVIGGIVGGLFFGAMMAAGGALPMIAKLVGSEDPIAGFLVHMGISSFIGATFALLFSTFITSPRRSAILGLAYGFVWWILGGLTLLPLFLGMPVQYANAADSANVGGLVGHLIYGFALGATYAVLASRTGLFAKAPAKAPTP